jgi:hypothetical protein
VRDFLSDLVHRTFEPGQEIEPRLASRFEPLGIGPVHSPPFELAFNTSPRDRRTMAPEDTAAAARSAPAKPTVNRGGGEYSHSEPVAMRFDAAAGPPTRALAADGSPQETRHARETTLAVKAGALIAEGEAASPFARSAATVESAANGSQPRLPDGHAGSSPVASSATDSVIGPDVRSGLQRWRAAAEHSDTLTPQSTSIGGVFGPPAPPAAVRWAPEIIQAGAESTAAAAAAVQDTPRSGQVRDLAQPPGLSHAENGSQLTPVPVVWNTRGAPSPPVALSPAAVTQSPGPTINVTIGRIEVRATPVPTPAKKTAPGGPVLTLNDYLRQRASGGGR